MPENEKQYVWGVFEDMEPLVPGNPDLDSIHSNEQSAEKRREVLELGRSPYGPPFYVEKIEVMTE